MTPAQAVEYVRMSLFRWVMGLVFASLVLVWQTSASKSEVDFVRENMRSMQTEIRGMRAEVRENFRALLKAADK